MLPKPRLITLALQEAAAARCSARAHAVLAHYVADSWPHGTLWRACTFNAELARRLSCSPRMIQAAAAELVQAGVIARVSKTHVVITVVAPADGVSDRATGRAVGDGDRATGSAVRARQVAPTARQVAPYPVQVKNILAPTRETDAQPQACSQVQPPGELFNAMLADEATPPEARRFLQARLERRRPAQVACDAAGSP